MLRSLLVAVGLAFTSLSVVPDAGWGETDSRQHQTVPGDQERQREELEKNEAARPLRLLPQMHGGYKSCGGEGGSCTDRGRVP